jgi:hypothetical protein
MADVLSRAVRRPSRTRGPRTRKYIVEPLTAEQISKGVKVTRKDAALVRKVLLELGFLKPEAPARTRAAGAKKASAVKKTVRARKVARAKKDSAK